MNISAVLTEIDIIKKKRPEFYNKLIMDILKNFFIYDFVICQNNSLLNQLKYAIIEGKDLIKFYENLNFVSRLTLLVVSFQFSFRYNELNMYIRNTFAEEKEYAKPFIEALTL